MGELTPKQLKVLNELRRAGGEYMTPTDIGMGCGQDYERASSWAAGALKALAHRGLAQRGSGPNAGMWAATQEALDG